MAIERVREHLRAFGKEDAIMEFETSSATVALAAEALGCIPARIAKTLSFHGQDGTALLVVAAGDTRVDNRKFRDRFGFKPKMLNPDEVLEQTGHAVGGVCPFGLARDLEVFLDVSLKRFDTVFPACGSANSAIEVTLGELETYSGGKDWIDVCKDWQDGTDAGGGQA